MIACIPNVLDRKQLKDVRAIIERADFVDGRSTAKGRAARVKANEQIRKQESDGTRGLDGIILGALRENSEFQRFAIPRSLRAPLISRYKPGMQYGLHVDNALMGSGRKERSDLSVTVFLNDPSEYEGGELIIRSHWGEQEIKLPAGDAVVYASSTLHRVNSVTQGERLAAVTWVQSYVRSAEQRELLYDLNQVVDKLAKTAPDEPETDLAYKSYSNLLRMWSDT